MADGYRYEIILVDNGSRDRTPEIAGSLGAQVVRHEGGTIAGARNLGVSRSTGEIIVFLDADVYVTEAWAARFPTALALLQRAPATLTGGWCAVPRDATLIERLWFAPNDPSSFSHIGTGHLITTRAFFDRIGGFDASLETGEDYDFSRRAVAAGGTIAADAALVAEHLGFPRTLRAFVAREAWHGRSDFVSLASIRRSKVAIATVIFAILHVVLVIGIVTLDARIAGFAIAAIVGLCALSAFVKFRKEGLVVLLGNSALFYFYYFGRFRALLHRSAGGSWVRSRRASVP